MSNIMHFTIMVIMISMIPSQSSPNNGMIFSRDSQSNSSEVSKISVTQCTSDEEDSKKENLIKINVGGEIILVYRNTLSRVENSRFNSIIEGSCSDISALDQDGNIYLDYNPILFRDFYEQLRNLKENDPVIFFAPPSRWLAISFAKMLQDFELDLVSVSNDDIITLNVGGELVVTRRQTLTKFPNSNLASMVSLCSLKDIDSNGNLFLDYDAKLFRHLLTQLRTMTCTEICTFNPPSIEYKEAFDSMLLNLGLIDSTSKCSGCAPTNDRLVSMNAKITASNYCDVARKSCAPPVSIYGQVKSVLNPDMPLSSYWNSGGYAPQYIQIELENLSKISNLFLQIAQTPNSRTRHSVLAGSQENNLVEVKILDGLTNNYGWINITFSPVLENIRFVRINTISSPSWVAWLKVLLFKP